MAEFKLAIADGPKSFAKTLADPQAASLLGLKLGAEVGGEPLGFPGYQFQITGGTDKSGFPMRADLPGGRQTKLLVSEGVGFHPARHGTRDRRTFRGNTISEDTVQVNLRVTARGPSKLEDLVAAK
jgi:small subunit ribosomal protein S6e